MPTEPLKNSAKEADFQRAKASSADANQAFEDGDISAALAHAETAYRALMTPKGKKERIKSVEFSLKDSNEGLPF